MKGFPKHLNSKEDYYYIKENFPAKKWRPKWQALLDERYRWRDTGELASPEEWVVDDTHRVETRVERDTESGEDVTKYYQQELQQNATADFWQFNFTEEEVLAALAEADN